MKSILSILFVSIFIIFSIQNSEANNTKFVKGDFYEGKIKWKEIKLDLPEGKWQFIRKNSWWFGGFGWSCKNFILKEGQIFKSLMSMCEMRTGGKYVGWLASALNKYYKRGDYDSCVLRPEYYYANLFIKGSSTNCLRIRHIDFDKEMYRPDDPLDSGTFRTVLRKWFNENDVIEPKILLSSVHEYFAPVIKDSGPGVYFLINPEAYGGPKNKYFTEETSEYHRNNIDKHPEFKKFMDEWTSLSAKRHQQFEIDWKAKNLHKLNLNDVMNDYSDMTLLSSDKEMSSISNNKDIVKQIKDLKELYDAGVLKKEEFEKAKKRLLN
jgi:hypothetical protein